MNDIFLNGEVGFEVTLETVINQIKETDENEPLNVHINSGGGGVFEGLAIYNHLKGLDREINTFANGIVASIASIIFLAGKNRTIHSTDNFLIHLPMGGAFGNAEDLEKQAETLRDIENTLSKIYALETSLTKKQALALMEKDEFLEVDFLKEKGIVNDIIKFKAVAIFNKNTMKQEITKEKVEGWFKSLMSKHFSKKETTNKTIQDADGVEISFPDLKNTDTPSIGDKALVDNKKASGDFLLPNGTTYTFENSELKIIKEKDVETVDSLKVEIETLKDEAGTSAQSIVDKDAEIKVLNTQITDMKAEIIVIKNKITGSFDYDKKDKKKSEDTASKSRSLFKEKQ